MTTEPVGCMGLKTISFQSPDKLISQTIIFQDYRVVSSDESTDSSEHRFAPQRPIRSQDLTGKWPMDSDAVIQFLAAGMPCAAPNIKRPFGRSSAGVKN
ncbi:Epididymal Sperm-Binding Protein 1 [Manis pentadactyla]|nr:Epididymal Sperm-Binding Protein 1 [Manis pentadactyla]